MNHWLKRKMSRYGSLLLMLVLAACQITASPQPTDRPVTVPPPSAVLPATPATTGMTVATLRSTLDLLLGEHVLLAASATNAALHGRDADFKAAAGALDQNSQNLAAAIGSVYGDEAAKAFLPLWRTHIGFFVDYTTGVAKGDQAAKAKALADLTQYAQDFGAFLASANPNLPKAAVVTLLGPHVTTLTAVIDAQAVNQDEAAFKALRQAYAHMDMIAGALAGAIGHQFPAKFTGAVEAPAANLRSGLTMLLAEHTYLAALATDAALGGRDAEFKAAAGALDQNSQDLAAAIGSVYSDAAAQAFLPLWRTHIGFFVDYAHGAANSDQAVQNKAITDLVKYAQDFGAFLASANPNLTKEGVAQELVPHINTLTTVIIAQAARKPEAAYPALRQAYLHMQMVADVLTDAIIKQFPDKFGMAVDETGTITATMPMSAALGTTSTESMSGTESMSSTMPMTGTSPLTDTMDVTNAMGMTSSMAMSGTGSMSATMPMTSTMDITDATGMSGTESMSPTMANPGMATATAGLLRANLDRVLGEHVLLAASATEAALRGRQAEFQAAVAALDANSVETAAAIGAIYGKAAEAAFLPLWRKHIGFFVDYTTGLATNDKAMQSKALADLDQYAEDFGAFLQSANPNLPQDAVAGLLREHAQTLIAVINAQATVTPQRSGDQLKAYPALQAAYAHMDMHATALAAGIAQQFPRQFPGAANAPAGDLRSALNMALGEHTYLVAKSTAAALAARGIEYEAAFAALDQNSQHLAAAIGSIYGDAAGEAFLPLWRKHIGFFIDYALALGQKDAKAQQMALDNLTAYAADFGAFLHAANPNLPAATVTELVTIHVVTTLKVIDAAASDNPATFYSTLRTAYAHMSMIANPLTDAIIAQFPDKFDETATAQPLRNTAPTNPTSTQVSVPVVINTFRFQPERIEVPVGTTVVWTNQDAIEHTVTAGTPGNQTGLFDSGFFNQGQQFSYTFTNVGEYAYFCQRHTSMRGVVVVVPATK